MAKKAMSKKPAQKNVGQEPAAPVKSKPLEEQLQAKVFQGVQIQLDRMAQVPLEDLTNNPWQAERSEDIAKLQELADSILEHGMLETPVVRPWHDGKKCQMASGHRRLAAHKLLVSQGHQQFATMRVRIAEFENSQMADVVIQENKKRLDLDPISEARFYKRYLEEFHVTQTDLAERVGCSQSEIANSLRLLELPADVQGKLIAREITAHHGRVLLTAAKEPEVQQAAIAALEKEPMSVRELTRVVEDKMREAHPPMLPELPAAPGITEELVSPHGAVTETSVSPAPAPEKGETADMTARLDKAVAGAGPQSPALALFEIEVMLSLSRNLPEIDVWFRQRTALGRVKFNEVEDRLDHFMRNKSYDELRRLASRLALEIMSLKLRDDQLKHYLKLLETDKEVNDGTITKT